MSNGEHFDKLIDVIEKMASVSERQIAAMDRVEKSVDELRNSMSNSVVSKIIQQPAIQMLLLALAAWAAVELGVAEYIPRAQAGELHDRKVGTSEPSDVESVPHQ